MRRVYRRLDSGLHYAPPREGQIRHTTAGQVLRGLGDDITNIVRALVELIDYDDARDVSFVFSSWEETMKDLGVDLPRDRLPTLLWVLSTIPLRVIDSPTPGEPLSVSIRELPLVEVNTNNLYRENLPPWRSELVRAEGGWIGDDAIIDTVISISPIGLRDPGFRALQDGRKACESDLTLVEDLIREVQSLPSLATAQTQIARDREEMVSECVDMIIEIGDTIADTLREQLEGGTE